MKKIMFTILFLSACTSIFSQDANKINDQPARIAPEWITKGIIYQIQPRAFTPEGTLNAAKERLPHIAELGATIVYLCPVFVSDGDTDTLTWSTRQKASKMNNPYNPYRMKDYYHVDQEYGTDEDLKSFINKAHSLGLRVMLDMVYLHCGAKAIFLEENPDFVIRDENGNMVNEKWNWPALNYENKDLREYLWLNMEYWVKDFDVDGFRMDVASGVPLDFWETSRTRLEKIRPDIGMLAEASETRRPADQLYAFDINYSFVYFRILKDVYEQKYPASILQKTWEEIEKNWPKGSRFIRYFDNHDISNDDYHNRRETRWGFDGCQAAFVHIFTMDGVPFIYNGQEIADTARHSIFGNAPIDWANSDRLAGQQRFSFLQELSKIRRNENCLTQGKLEWINNNQSESVLSYIRTLNGEQILTIVNFSNQPQRVKFEGIKNSGSFKVLIKKSINSNIDNGLELPAFGFWIGKNVLD